MTAIDAAKARAALIDLPEETSYGETPDPKQVYLPRSHLKAMDLNVPLVTGARGAGKTFWWGALQRSGVRRLIDLSLVRSAPREDTRVVTGFGAKSSADYPGIDVLPMLMKEHEPRVVWRTVAARHVAREGHPLRSMKSWKGRVEWADAEPEAVDRLFHERDAKCDRENRHFLILFDALDRSAYDWKDMYRAIRGLLQIALEMRPYRRLRVKMFLRPDQLDKNRIGDFPDASKPLSSQIELEWPRRELYGLLWHCVANGDHGKLFRTFFGGRWKPVGSDTEKSYPVPRELVDEDKQRNTFHELSCPLMGRNHRRGFPYTWIPNHLGDGKARVSPRPFLRALRKAAEDTEERFPDHGHPLHYDSIKRGVQEASTIRVDEIREDHPWIHRVLEPLRGMSVPSAFDEVRKRWRDEGVLDVLEQEIKQRKIKLPPRRMEDGPRGIREDLEAAGVFQPLLDGRVNIPDIFRVGYGIGRKGGVRPVR